MKYVDLLKKHYEEDNSFCNINSLPDEYGYNTFTINYIIYGSNANNKLNEIEKIIREFFNEVILKDENSGEILRYVDYNTSRAHRTATGIVTRENSEKTLSYITSNEVGSMSIEKHKILEGLSITNEKRYGEVYAKIEYKNYPVFFKDNTESTYCIEITFPYDKYSKFSSEKKKWLHNFVKTAFCELNAIGAAITFYKNFYYNTQIGLAHEDYLKTDGSKLYGIHWCNLLCEKKVRMLGGIDIIKEAVNKKCVVESFKSSNGKDCALIQLSESEIDLEKEDFLALKELYVPYMSKVKKRDILIMEQLIADMQEGTQAYEAHVRALNDDLFTYENILFLDEDDVRWV